MKLRENMTNEDEINGKYLQNELKLIDKNSLTLYMNSASGHTNV